MVQINLSAVLLILASVAIAPVIADDPLPTNPSQAVSVSQVNPLPLNPTSLHPVSQSSSPLFHPKAERPHERDARESKERDDIRAVWTMNLGPNYREHTIDEVLTRGLKRKRRRISKDYWKAKARARKATEIRRRSSRKARIHSKTGKKLILRKGDIPKLTTIGLKRQLKWHRKNEITFKRMTGVTEKGRVPPRKVLKTNEVRRKALKEAIGRFNARPSTRALLPVERDGNLNGK